MGVSGSGKSTLAGELSFALRWPLVEGDSLHPQANILKMSTGVPLTDADRQPWLEDIGRVVRDWIDSDTCGVITCSSLKRRYRDTISGGNTRVCFVYVKGAQADIAPRLNRRTGHFMPSTMLDSQFAALEEPGEDECVLSVDVRASRDSLTKATLDALDGLTA
ncbi:gluconokinase [Ameyamaea chiangmaiensis]|nr:gluconokinase [Ameyamaea chiangmaiensis]MBS4074286.1 gluconokinase [Ameyamaea chiangmaiensis]